ncbi:P-loop NTPase [Geoglobus acetivorans]|uniref:Septum site-determining protein MinD n=1 Tax=Geoglobus acetivorans TaxID=565033 RepID=A0A0A7GFA2_GEOAI|nr:Septum site-determining protein MinD [Geoglobus acetivorans]
MPVIAITSGKGGVGKTTISVNTAIALSSVGRTLIIDGDIALPNVHVLIGLEEFDQTFLDALRNPGMVEDAIKRVEYVVGRAKVSVDVLPASTSLDSLEKADITRFGDIVEILEPDYDFLIIDVAAGLSKYALMPMLSAEKTYVVTNPDRISVSDASRVVNVATEAGVYVSGVVVNRYRGDKKALDEIQERVHTEIAGIIRESSIVRRSWENGIPFVVSHPSSAVSRDVTRLAMNIAGIRTEIKKYGKLKYLLGLA